MIKRIIILIILLVLFFASMFFVSFSSDHEERVFSINRGEGLQEIAQNLEDEGFIGSDIFFNIYAYLIGKEKDLKAGDYMLSKSMSIRKIAEKIYKGNTEAVRITVIEGWSIKNIAEYLDERGIVSGDEFFEAAEEYEGYLFPDTYELPQNVTIQQLIVIMRANFDKKVDQKLRDEIARQGKTLEQIIIMASIIEKEVITFEDKKLVSGILWKRIRIGMPLQSCATISYITGRKTTKIPVEETKIDSPYNTYKYTGLPKGPICNPSLDSIEAAIYPQDSVYLYHLSTPEGETIFSRSLQEHNIAKAKYLK